MTDHLGPSVTTPLSTQEPRDRLLLGRYRIMNGGTEGGFGTVLTCWDTRLQRRVAIKRMPLAQPGMPQGTASAIDEALAEARTSSLLAHPNIVTVFDFETDFYFAYLVMEYVDGLTLTELLSRVEGGTLTPDECSYIVDSVAGALTFAHENGVLHLDLKPSNIMIDHAGTVKLCDFGMATLASATGFGGARGGTVGYMPPEQILGEVVDERTDIFSLAVVTWQALAGSNPFAAPTADASLRLIERGPKPPLSKTVPSVQGMAEEAIMQALEPQRASRVPSIDAFAREVVFGLGDPSAGAASIKELLEQATPEEGDSETLVREALPFAYRHPKLGPALLRLAAAALTVPLSFQASGLLFQVDTRGQAVACALVAACALAWPPLSSILALGMIVLALFSTVTSAALALMPLAFLVLLVGWWALSGRLEGIASVAVLSACLTGQPLAAAPLVAFGLGPLDAALACAAAVLIQPFYAASAAAGFNVAFAVDNLGPSMLHGGYIVCLLGTVLAGVAGAAITRKWHSVAAGIVGQIVCLTFIVSSQVAAAWVENGDIWQSVNWTAAGLGVLLSILACIATALRGPLSADEEVGTLDELA